MFLIDVFKVGLLIMVLDTVWLTQSCVHITMSSSWHTEAHASQPYTGTNGLDSNMWGCEDMKVQRALPSLAFPSWVSMETMFSDGHRSM